MIAKNDQEVNLWVVIVQVKKTKVKRASNISANLAATQRISRVIAAANR